MNLTTMVVPMALDASKYKSGLDKAVKDTDSSSKSMANKLTSMATTATKALAGLAVAGLGAVVAGMTQAVRGTIEWQGILEDTSRKLGTTTEQTAGLALAAKASGLNIDDLSGMLVKMAKGLGEAQGKLGPTDKALESLGLSAYEANGKLLDTPTLLSNISDKLSTMPDGLEKTTLEMTLFGKSGADMGELLEKASNGGMQTYIDQAKKVGLVMTKEQMDSAEALNLAIGDLGTTFQGFGILLGSSVTPMLQKVATRFNEWLNDEEVQQSFKDFGTWLAGPFTDTILNLADTTLPKLSSAFNGVKTVIDGIASLPKWLTSTGASIVAIGAGSLYAGSKITTFISKLAEGEGVLASLAQKFTTFVGMGGLGKWFLAIADLGVGGFALAVGTVIAEFVALGFEAKIIYGQLQDYIFKPLQDINEALRTQAAIILTNTPTYQDYVYAVSSMYNMNTEAGIRKLSDALIIQSEATYNAANSFDPLIDKFERAQLSANGLTTKVEFTDNSLQNLSASVYNLTALDYLKTQLDNGSISSAVYEQKLRDLQGFIDVMHGKTIDVFVNENWVRVGNPGANTHTEPYTDGQRGPNGGVMHKINGNWQETFPTPSPIIPGHASGGSFNANQAIMVGERGPEVIVPSTSGEVISNNRLSGMSGKMDLSDSTIEKILLGFRDTMIKVM